MRGQGEIRLTPTAQPLTKSPSSTDAIFFVSTKLPNPKNPMTTSVSAVGMVDYYRGEGVLPKSRPDSPNPPGDPPVGVITRFTC